MTTDLPRPRRLPPDEADLHQTIRPTDTNDDALPTGTDTIIDIVPLSIERSPRA